MHHPKRQHSVDARRRAILRATASIGALSVAGCSGELSADASQLAAAPPPTQLPNPIPAPAPVPAPTPTPTPPPERPTQPTTFTPQYSLPSSGQAVAIGVNHALSVTPTEDGFTAAEWDYSLFNSYGGGVFVEKYSAAGAYVLAGTGGHNHPDNPGAVVFDFANARWSRLDNTQGVARKTTSPHAFLESESTGAPWYEWPGTQVPLPAHPYRNLAYSPDGAKGSVVYITRAAVGAGASSSDRVHRFDLATRQWSRVGTGGSDRMINGGFESDGLWDAVRNRWWYIIPDHHYLRNVAYLDRSDSTWKTTASSSSWHPHMPGASFMHDGYILRNTGGSLYLFDPDLPAEGWILLSVSGSLPQPAASRWARYRNGNWYAYAGAGGNTMQRIVPPDNPKTGAWTVSNITVSGASLPVRSGSTAHYSRFIDVPAIGCLAWIPGGSNPVFLIRPE